ncbi:MAG: pyruvate kinase [Chloroflexota bacterium]
MLRYGRRVKRPATPALHRTRIVATLGPATDRPGVLEAILDAGVDVVRLNMSHGTQADHAGRIGRVRQLEGNRTVAILADLQGPKIRVGAIGVGSLALDEGAPFVLTNRDVVAAPGIATLDYPPLPREVAPGMQVLLDDGNLALRVDATDGHDIRTTVIRGGRLTSHKGINVPGAPLSAPALTEKDLDDAAFAAGAGVDFLALSFVRQGADIIELRDHLLRRGFGRDHCAVIAKIERPEALAAIEDILAEADGLMVARGDLGVELPLHDVPRIQRDLLTRCNRVGKPAITATQMLESMVTSARPTRAEATDVHVAVTGLTDAVMLSAETATGRYPVEAVAAMRAIATAAEGVLNEARHFALAGGDVARDATEAVAQAAVEIATELGARAIVTVTAGGATPRAVAKYRPPMPVVALTASERVRRRLALTWGVLPVSVPSFNSTDDIFVRAAEAPVTLGCAAPGDLIVITAGIPLGFVGGTNLMKVHRIGDPLPGAL